MDARFRFQEPQQKDYNFGMFNMNHPAEMHTFFKEGTKQLGREVANWSELDPK